MDLAYQEASSKHMVPVLTAVIPVSYTHLDVYKRQTLTRGDMVSQCNVNV